MEKKQVTRIYEVPAEPGKSTTAGAPAAASYGKTFLVDAVSQSAAERHVASKYVGKAVLPNGKRIAELMGAGNKVESVPAE